MYLACKTINGIPHFFIRESYYDDTCFRSRNLVELGPDPGRYIIYPGGNAYFFDETIEDQLEKLGVTNVSDQLEDIFWPFLDPRIKRVVEAFTRKGAANRKPLNCDVHAANDTVHLFDKRRIHYLRCGRMEQGNIGRISPKMTNVIRNKSRDEIEQYFMQSEKILRPHEMKPYLFVIFDLQRHFSALYAKTMPQALDEGELDAFFLNDVCRLNEDVKFWQGIDKGGNLHDYMARYVILFFDTPFGETTIVNDYVKNFINSRKRFRFSSRQKTVRLSEISARLGIASDMLRKMSRRELTIHYRRLALKLHPDKGGDHEKFIKLTEAYQEMLKKKKP